MGFSTTGWAFLQQVGLFYNKLCFSTTNALGFKKSNVLGLKKSNVLGLKMSNVLGLKKASVWLRNTLQFQKGQLGIVPVPVLGLEKSSRALPKAI